MYDDNGQELFGRDWRNRPPITVLLPAKFSYVVRTDNRDYDGNRYVNIYRTFFTDKSMTPRQLKDVRSFSKFADAKMNNK